MRVLRDPAEIAALAPAWDALLARSAANRAFGSARWFLAWCEVAPAWEPWVFATRRGGELAGVLALVRQGSGPLCFPGELADYQDAVVARGDLSTTRELVAAARREGFGLSLTCLRPDANLAQALGEALGEPLGCPYVDLRDGYENYLASRSPRFRYHLRRARRRAAEADIDLLELLPATFPAVELPARFLALHGERFARSCFDRPLDRAFAQRALPALFAERRLRAFGVWESGELIALSLCMVGNTSLGHWNGGWRAVAARFAPGKLLFDLEVQTCCREGLAELDLMRGEEPYKAGWTESRRTLGSWKEVPR